MKKILIPVVLSPLLTTASVAHVRFETASATANSFTEASLIVPHGCGDSPTQSITLKIADGVSQVSPRQIPGWDVSITKRTLKTPILIRGFEVYETVDTITWSGGNLPSFAYQKFGLHLKTPDAVGKTLYFPVHQACETGSADWVNIPKPSYPEEQVADPAPVIYLTNGKDK